MPTIKRLLATAYMSAELEDSSNFSDTSLIVKRRIQFFNKLSDSIIEMILFHIKFN